MQNEYKNRMRTGSKTWPKSWLKMCLHSTKIILFFLLQGPLSDLALAQELERKEKAKLKYIEEKEFAELRVGINIYRYVDTTCFIYNRKSILQITQPSQYRCTQLQYV